MAIDLPVDPGLVHVFARAVGDDDAADAALLTDPGNPMALPLTYARAAAEHFDSEGELRFWPGGSPTPVGGGPGQFHAEQYFEYFKQMRAGDLLHGTTYGGRTWTKRGRTGELHFAEIITDFVDDAGELVIRSRKVGVRVAAGNGDD